MASSTGGNTYSLTWLNSVLGAYSVTAKATDNLGVTTTSAAITVSVVQSGPTIVYYHNDFSGSPLAATDSNGTVIWNEAYAPFGERYLSEDTTDQNAIWFAGKPTEDTAGLSYFGGRWYNPKVGRFYSVDPQRFRDDNPLSFNRYAYANNNPYRFVDPNGDSPIDIGFLVWDLGKLGVALYNGSGAGEAAIDVAISAVAVIVPVPGSGLAIKALRSAEKIAETAKAADVATGLGAKAVSVSRSQFPEAAKHIEEAQAAGLPSALTINRAGAAARRREALRSTPTKPGLDRDEYSPAMFGEGGNGASVRHINPGDNRGAGACIGAQCRGLPNGSQVTINVGP